MIRTNLSSRPFYNEAAVHFWLAVVALVAVVATGLNVSRVLTYSRSDTALAVQADRDEARAADLRRSAATLRASVDAKQIDAAAAQAREANDLIDRRTFSWTELFNRFETTLPDEVRITGVRPRIDRERGIVLSITVVAQNGNVEPVNQFMENLEKTGAFVGVWSRDDHFNDAGQLQSQLEAVYHPEARPETGAGASKGMP